MFHDSGVDMGHRTAYLLCLGGVDNIDEDGNDDDDYNNDHGPANSSNVCDYGVRITAGPTNCNPGSAEGIKLVILMRSLVILLHHYYCHG
jgi:hypothetical protein